MTTVSSRATLFHIPIDLHTSTEIVSEVRAAIHRRQRITITYTHFDVLLTALQEETVRQLINSADINYVDGVGVHFALWFLKGMRLRRINATDTNILVLQEGVSQTWSIFLVGGNNEIEQPLFSSLKDAGADLSFIRWIDGYRDLEDDSVVTAINDARPDLVLVGMGGVRQFEWIAKHRTGINAPVVMAVGGFLEFLSRTKRRAPVAIRALGLEWMHRLWLEPRRLWRRYLTGIPVFLWLVLKEKIGRPVH